MSGKEIRELLLAKFDVEDFVKFDRELIRLNAGLVLKKIQDYEEYSKRKNESESPELYTELEEYIHRYITDVRSTVLTDDLVNYSNKDDLDKFKATLNSMEEKYILAEKINSYNETLVDLKQRISLINKDIEEISKDKSLSQADRKRKYIELYELRETTKKTYDSKKAEWQPEIAKLQEKFNVRLGNDFNELINSFSADNKELYDIINRLNLSNDSKQKFRNLSNSIFVNINSIAQKSVTKGKINGSIEKEYQELLEQLSLSPKTEIELEEEIEIPKIEKGDLIKLTDSASLKGQYPGEYEVIEVKASLDKKYYVVSVDGNRVTFSDLDIELARKKEITEETKTEDELKTTDMASNTPATEEKKSEYLVFNGRIGRIPGEKVDFSTLKKGEKYEIESVRNDGKEIKISGIDGWFSRASFWTEKEWEERKTRVIDIDTPEKAEDLTINGIEVDDYVKLSKYGIDHYHDLSATHGSDFKLDTFGEYKVVKITPAIEGKQVYITVDVNGKEVEFDSDVFELSRKKYEKKVEVEIGDFVKLNGKKATIPDGSDPFDSIFKTINDPNNDLDPEKDYEVVGISSYNGNKEYTILVDGKEVRYSAEYFDLSRKKELIIKPEEKESPVLDGATHKVDEPPVAASTSESFEEVAPPMESFDLDDDEDEIERKPKKRKLITKIEEFGINDFMALQYLKLGVVGTVAALALSGGTLGVIVAAGTVVLTGLRKTQKVSKVLEPIDRTIIKKFTGVVDKIKSTLSKKSSKGESISPDEEDLVSELSGIDKAMKEMETPEKDKDKGMAF